MEGVSIDPSLYTRAVRSTHASGLHHAADCWRALPVDSAGVDASCRLDTAPHTASARVDGTAAAGWRGRCWQACGACFGASEDPVPYRAGCGALEDGGAGGAAAEGAVALRPEGEQEPGPHLYDPRHLSRLLHSEGLPLLPCHAKAPRALRWKRRARHPPLVPNACTRRLPTRPSYFAQCVETTRRHWKEDGIWGVKYVFSDVRAPPSELPLLPCQHRATPPTASFLPPTLLAQLPLANAKRPTPKVQTRAPKLSAHSTLDCPPAGAEP